jgi:hypothetical protein
MVHAVVLVVAAGIMANPDSPVDVGSIGMVGAIAEVAALIAAMVIVSFVAAVALCLMIVAVIGLRSAGGRGMTLPVLTAVLVFLGKRRYADDQQCR